VIEDVLSLFKVKIGIRKKLLSTSALKNPKPFLERIDGHAMVSLTFG
jgi:hypothetical protein